VRIELRGGKVLEKHVEHALGSFERPLSDADLEAKFRSLVSGVLPDAQAARLIDLCWRVGELEDAGSVAREAAKT
jgi:2-methylcitrate dehydratase PrpD